MIKAETDQTKNLSGIESGFMVHSLFHYMSSGIIVCKVKNQGQKPDDYIVEEISDSIYGNTGKKATYIIGSCLSKVFSELADPDIFYHIRKTVVSGKSSKFRQKNDTSANWCEFQLFLLSSGDLAIIYEDITDLVMEENNLRFSSEKYRTLIENMNEVVYTLDSEARINYISPNISKLGGYSVSQVLGKTFTDFVYPQDLSERMVNFQNAFAGQAIRTEYRMMTADKKIIWVSTKASPVRKGGKTIGVQGILTDITEKRQTELENFYLNNHDSLTGLYNRQFIEEQIIKSDTEDNYPLALIIVDVNGLKLTNDAFGYTAGDQLLKDVAAMLRIICGDNCLIGRTGGDEFAMVLKNTDYASVKTKVQEIDFYSDRSSSGSALISLSVGYAVKTDPEQKIEEVRTKAENMMYKNKLKHGKTMRSRTIETVLRSINNKYDKEQIHTERVAQYCEKIARRMGLSEDEIEIVKTAGILHDIGKIMIPASLLNKPGKLSENEFAVIKRHPETSCLILREVEEYSPLAEIVLYHHERWDGNGYPYKLKGEQIPLISRIISVADAFEAMTADRPYQKRKTKEQAIKELADNAGKQFDPDIARLFIQMISEDG